MRGADGPAHGRLHAILGLLALSALSRPAQRAIDAWCASPRRALKTALANLAKCQGDITALEENLAGFWRLRVGRFRIVIRDLDGDRIDCVFAKERQLVYELFATQLREKL